jgi:hypothetical protein
MGQVHGRITRLAAQVAKRTHSNRELAHVRAAWIEFIGTVLKAQSNPLPLFGDLGDYPSLEEAFLARLLLVKPRSQQQPAMGGLFKFGSSSPQVDIAYARSLLAPEAWIENSQAASGFHQGMRQYGVGRRVGQCEPGGDMGLFPEDAKEGDVLVHLYGAANVFVLRETMSGYLLVGDASEFFPLYVRTYLNCPFVG